MTIGFFVAYLLMAHTAPWVIVFGVENSVRVFGYPLHYFMAVVLGWFGVLAVSIAWNHYADRLEEEIAAADEAGESRAPGTAGVAAKGVSPAGGQS